MPTILKTSHFVQEATDHIVRHILVSLESTGSCVLCLAGGKTPMPIYEALSKASIDWAHIYITFGDERDVPSDDMENNYKMAHDSLLSKINIPLSNILRIETELGVVEAAINYEQKLITLKTKLGRDYLFDITLLGIGGDGHTASLFPGTAALNENKKLVVDNDVPQLGKKRITLTYPALNSSKEIIFLINDPSKKTILENIWNEENFPATKIKPAQGAVTWIVGE